MFSKITATIFVALTRKVKTKYKKFPKNITEAFSALEIASKWLEEQEEATNYSVSLLEALKDLSASKIFETLKQCKMTDFINKCNVTHFGYPENSLIRIQNLFSANQGVRINVVTL